MGNFLVTAPEAGYTGKVAGVAFGDGRATVDGEQHRAAMSYFRRKGYRIEALHNEGQDATGDDGKSNPADPEPADPKVPARSASKADWVKHVTSDAAGDQRLSDDDAQAKTRDELAEHVLGPKEV